MAAAPGGGVDAYVVPSEDPHQSEYSAECFGRRAWLSGFTGSAGTAVVTAGAAALWTDGRYFLQAQAQLPDGWALMRSAQPGVPNIDDWLCETLPDGARVGFDPYLHSADAAATLRATLARKGQALVPLYTGNLVDSVWGAARPPPPFAPLRVHDLAYAGAPVAAKLAEVRTHLTEAGATATVVSMLDEVAWLLNVRGGDVPHCPVALAYAVVSLDSATLFVDAAKVTEPVAAHLASAGVGVQPYEDMVPEMQ
eukprot:SM002279S07718  [mRNA]  locus=s2279:28:1558:+ [translate_table: standard]